MKDFFSDYLNTKVLYGGYIATRAEVIQDLRRIGAGEREIGLYMSGLKEWKPEDEALKAFFPDFKAKRRA